MAGRETIRHKGYGRWGKRIYFDVNYRVSLYSGTLVIGATPGLLQVFPMDGAGDTIDILAVQNEGNNTGLSVTMGLYADSAVTPGTPAGLLTNFGQLGLLNSFGLLSELHCTPYTMADDTQYWLGCFMQNNVRLSCFDGNQSTVRLGTTSNILDGYVARTGYEVQRIYELGLPNPFPYINSFSIGPGPLDGHRVGVLVGCSTF